MPRYAKIAARTNCAACGQPVPLTTLAQDVSCPYCFASNSVSPSSWIELLKIADERSDRGLSGDGALGVGTHQLVFNVEPGEPRCEKCGAPLPADALADSEMRNFACVSCGDPASTEPVPAWARQAAPSARQVFSVDPKPGLGGHAALSEPVEAMKPVVMSCPRCGGGLEITNKSERILACRFCSADVYLPDEIWRRLHPIKTMDPFYIRFEGPSEWSRNQDAVAMMAGQQEAARMARAQQSQRSTDDRLLQATAAKKLALILALMFGAAMVGATFASWACYTRKIEPPTEALVAAAIVMGIFVLVTTWLVTKPIQLATGRPFEWILFVTWFWLPFVVMMPVVGQVMGLVRALILARGSFAGATITSGSSRTTYSPISLPNGEGIPGAIFFFALSTMWPLALLPWMAPDIAQNVLDSLGM